MLQGRPPVVGAGPFAMTKLPARRLARHAYLDVLGNRRASCGSAGSGCS